MLKNINFQTTDFKVMVHGNLKKVESILLKKLILASAWFPRKQKEKLKIENI